MTFRKAPKSFPNLKHLVNPPHRIGGWNMISIILISIIVLYKKDIVEFKFEFKFPIKISVEWKKKHKK